MAQIEQTAANTLKAYFQLLADLASASGAGCQIFIDQVTPDNVLRMDAQNGLLTAASNSMSKVSELVPQAYAKYWKALQA